ncbi:MAG: PHP domain-containing protein [Candidatus Helarchaeota archaeon]
MMDLHVHTIFSDGTCSIQEACSVAARKNLTTIAISDHFTTTWKSSAITTVTLDSVTHYLKAIEIAKMLTPIKVIPAIEIDCGSSWEIIAKLPLSKFALINFEYVTRLEQVEKIIELRESLDLSNTIFSLAHSAIFMYASEKELDPIISCLTENDIAMELNSRYAHYFRQAEPIFRLLIEKEVKFSIGSDAHFPEDIGNVQEQYSFLEKLSGSHLLLKF